MTDNNLMTKELSLLLGCDEKDTDKYSDIINVAADSVKALLKDEAHSNNARIMHLCAVKAYYHIMLTQEDEINSFSAGDVSYSKNTTALGRAEKLLNTAINDCSDLLKNKGFAFKVV